MATFVQMQVEFADLTLDTTTTWASWWTQNKNCINKAYEYLYDKLKNAQRVKEKIATEKTSVTITSKAGTLPATFDTMYLVSTSDFATNSDIFNTTDENDWMYFNYIVKGTIAGSKTIILDDDITPIYVKFVPKRADLSADSDVPVLPQELHRSIVDFAMVEYFRRIRDDISTSNALMLANQLLNERLKTLN